MTTDITELAQREKFEAWAEHACAAPWGYLKKRRTSDDAYQEPNTTDMWAAWKAAGAELVKALEKAQKSNEFLKGQLSELANFNPDWDKLEASYDSWREIAAELLVAKERIAELESRTVTVKLPEPFKLAKSSSGLMYYYADEVDAALTAAGIKWEAE